MQIASVPNFDDVTCKHVAAEENAFIVLNSLVMRKKHHFSEYNIVIIQIVISLTSSPSGTGVYVM